MSLQRNCGCAWRSDSLGSRVSVVESLLMLMISTRGDRRLDWPLKEAKVLTSVRGQAFARKHRFASPHRLCSGDQPPVTVCISRKNGPRTAAHCTASKWAWPRTPSDSTASMLVGREGCRNAVDLRDLASLMHRSWWSRCRANRRTRSAQLCCARRPGRLMSRSPHL